MERRFQRLHITQPLPDNDLLILRGIVALCRTGKVREFDLNPCPTLQSLDDCSHFFGIQRAFQIFHRGGNLLAGGLAHIKYIHFLESQVHDRILQNLGLFCAIGVILLVAEFIYDRTLDLLHHVRFERDRREYLNAGFALVDLPPHLFPLVEGCDQTGIRLLQGDQHSVTRRIVRKLGHEFEVVPVFFRCEYLLYSCVDSLENLLHFGFFLCLVDCPFLRGILFFPCHSSSPLWLVWFLFRFFCCFLFL